MVVVRETSVLYQQSISAIAQGHQRSATASHTPWLPLVLPLGTCAAGSLEKGSRERRPTTKPASREINAVAAMSNHEHPEQLPLWIGSRPPGHCTAPQCNEGAHAGHSGQPGQRDPAATAKPVDRPRASSCPMGTRARTQAMHRPSGAVKGYVRSRCAALLAARGPLG